MDSFDLYVTHLRSKIRKYPDQPGLIIEIWLSPVLIRTFAKETVIEMLERALDISPLADAFLNEYIRELKLEIEDERWEELA